MSATRQRSSRQRAAIRRALLSAVALGAVLAVGGGGEARAASGAVFALEPLETHGEERYFVIAGRRGATIRRELRVVNTGTRAGTVLLYPSDATTGSTTGAVYRPPGAPRRGVGAWTRLGARSLDLAAGESRTVTVTVRVPERVREGQHLGGVTAEAADVERGVTRRRGAGRFRVDVRSLTIIAVRVDVPGKAVERLAVTGAHAGRTGAAQAVLVGLRNSGNQLLKGSGRLTIDDHAGKRVKDVRFPIDTFVAQTRIANPITVPGRALPQGDYRATVDLRYGHGRRTTTTVPLTISREHVQQISDAGGTPPQPAQDSGPPILWLVLGGIALLGAGFAAAALLFGRRRVAAPEHALEH